MLYLPMKKLNYAIFCAAKVEKLAEFNRRVSLTSDPCLLYHITVGVPSLLRFSLDEFSTKIDDETKDAIKELAVVVHDLKNPK
uniref:Uncharacterized protein n=1 Tax=Panagrolaimus superbus TaxID=310955 RepID=A0A914XV79_9BILA